MSKVLEFRWLRHGEPMPDGWQLSEQRLLHHCAWAVLIEPIGQELETPDPGYHGKIAQPL